MNPLVLYVPPSSLMDRKYNHEYVLDLDNADSVELLIEVLHAADALCRTNEFTMERREVLAEKLKWLYEEAEEQAVKNPRSVLP